MSRKFRWFLLGACVFVVLMGGGDAVSMLSAGPARPRTPSDLARSQRARLERSIAPLQVHADGELARKEAR